jgi:hypothetical protein
VSPGVRVFDDEKKSDRVARPWPGIALAGGHAVGVLFVVKIYDLPQVTGLGKFWQELNRRTTPTSAAAALKSKFLSVRFLYMMQISTQSNSGDRLRSLRASQVLVAACLYFIALGLVHATGQPPHIIFIYTDDHARWATGAYGSKDALTPHIDRIGREGAIFERAFVTTPVCSPSRAGLLTSQYSFRTGITDFIQFVREPELGLSPQFVTWPQLLRQRGYHTAIFGKWHLGLRPESSPVQFGYDTVSVFADVPGGSTKMDPLMEIDGVQTKVTGFGGDIITDAAIGFLKENARLHPVLISLHLREPHVPYERCRK